MRVLLVGLGSMGRRRAALLRKIDSKIEITGADSNIARCVAFEKVYGIKAYQNVTLLLLEQSFDVAVIATSPQYHAELIRLCLHANMHVFTELNLQPDLYAENMEMAKEKGRTLFLSSTFLYREEIKYIQSRVLCNLQKINYTYHVGQYLPDWHPWENYKNYFVGDKKTNACREIFAIELPWLTKTYGEVTSFDVVRGKISSLNIDYCDTYHLILTHDSGAVGSLVVDVVSRKATRNLEIYGEDLYISWDGSPLGLKEYDFVKKEEKSILLYEKIDKLQGYSSIIVENAYQNELQCFLDEIAGLSKAEYTFKDDLKILELIDRIEGE